MGWLVQSEDKRLAWEKEFYWLHVLEPTKDLENQHYDTAEAERPGSRGGATPGRQVERLLRKVGGLSQEVVHLESRVLHSLKHVQASVDRLSSHQAAAAGVLNEEGRAGLGAGSETGRQVAHSSGLGGPISQSET